MSVSHFKASGCISYAHILEELRKKLDKRSEKYHFLAYSEKSKAYRLYNLDTKKFLISRDVKFLQYRSWNEEETSYDQTPFFKMDEQQEPRARLLKF